MCWIKLVWQREEFVTSNAPFLPNLGQPWFCVLACVQAVAKLQKFGRWITCVLWGVKTAGEWPQLWVQATQAADCCQAGGLCHLDAAGPRPPKHQICYGKMMRDDMKWYMFIHFYIFIPFLCSTPSWSNPWPEWNVGHPVVCHSWRAINCDYCHPRRFCRMSIHWPASP